MGDEDAQSKNEQGGNSQEKLANRREEEADIDTAALDYIRWDDQGKETRDGLEHGSGEDRSGLVNLPFAARMMAKMGYVPGEGLGKEDQGITTFLQPSRKLGRAGIGAAEGTELASSISQMRITEQNPNNHWLGQSRRSDRPQAQGRRNFETIAPVWSCPFPSQAYMAKATQAPVEQLHPRTLLVILDLNGTLIHRRVNNRSKQFFRRKHTDSFLAYLFLHHSVMVWSSAEKDNILSICARLFTPAQRQALVAIWGRDRLQLPPELRSQKVNVYKQLSWVWADQEIQNHSARSAPWDQSNTVLIDDSFEKASSEPCNLIKVSTFMAQAEQMRHDETLQKVREYVEKLRIQVDVSAYIRTHPFRL